MTVVMLSKSKESHDFSRGSMSKHDYQCISSDLLRFTLLCLFRRKWRLEDAIEFFKKF